MDEGKKCWQINAGISQVKQLCNNCQAYKENKNCWEIESRPCTNSFATCILVNCPVYVKNKEIIEAQLTDIDIEEVKKNLLTILDKKCWEYKNCSLKDKEDCPAYADKRSCWEIGICGLKREDCHLCPIYIYHVRFEDQVSAK